MKISIVIPTLNAMRTLNLCLQSIYSQDYSHDLIEIIVADAGSSDGTIELFEKYSKSDDKIKVIIMANPLKTAEAGKAVGARVSNGDIIVFIDSDNILPDGNWLSMMVEPFADNNIVASEPLYYTYRRGDSYINRYCALMGMNDCFCFFLGNYDRWNYISNTWTEVARDEKDCGSYLSIRFDKIIPTMGANGFLIRKDALLENFEGDYLFDIDVLWTLFDQDNNIRVAKVKTGVIHLFCDNVSTYIRKQKRRINDFIFFKDKQVRKYPWNSFNRGKLIKFCLYTCFLLPLILQALKGNMHKKDVVAWCFHPIACIITLWVYGTGTIKGFFKKEMISRENWKQ